MARKRPNGTAVITKLAKCKRCGEQELGWVQSNAGRWYLAQAYSSTYLGNHREYIARKFMPHRCDQQRGSQVN